MTLLKSRFFHVSEVLEGVGSSSQLEDEMIFVTDTRLLYNEEQLQQRAQLSSSDPSSDAATTATAALREGVFDGDAARRALGLLYGISDGAGGLETEADRQRDLTFAWCACGSIPLRSPSSPSDPTSAASGRDGSATDGDHTRQRVLLWKTLGNLIALEEVSLGSRTLLVKSHLQIVLPFPIVPSPSSAAAPAVRNTNKPVACIQTSSAIYLFVATQFTVHRLVFPQPTLNDPSSAASAEDKKLLALAVRKKMSQLSLGASSAASSASSSAAAAAAAGKASDSSSHETSIIENIVHPVSLVESVSSSAAALSVLAQVTPGSIMLPDHHLAIATPNCTPTSIAAVSESLVVLGCSNGRTLLVRFPTDDMPHDETELKELSTSVVSRLWSGLSTLSTTPKKSLLSSAGLASTGTLASSVPSGVVSVAALSLQETTFQPDAADTSFSVIDEAKAHVSILQSDGRLSIWSPAERTCLANIDLAEFVSLDQKHSIGKSHSQTLDMVRFLISTGVPQALGRDAELRQQYRVQNTALAHSLHVVQTADAGFLISVFLSLREMSQFLFFEGSFLEDASVRLVHVGTKFAPSSFATVHDVAFTTNALWALTRADSGGAFQISFAPRNGDSDASFGAWRLVALSTADVEREATPLPLAFISSGAPPSDTESAPPKPTTTLSRSQIHDIFVSRIFAAGRFSKSVIRSGLALFAEHSQSAFSQPLDASTTVAQLRDLANLLVSGVVRDPGDTSETTDAWYQLYTCCLRAQTLSAHPLGLLVLDELHIYGVVRADGIGLLRSDEPLDALLCTASDAPAAVVGAKAAVLSAAASRLPEQNADTRQAAQSTGDGLSSAALSVRSFRAFASQLVEKASLDHAGVARLLNCMAMVARETHASVDDLLIDSQDPWVAVSVRLSPVFEGSTALFHHTFGQGRTSWSSSPVLTASSAAFPVQFAAAFKPIKEKLASIALLLLLLEPRSASTAAAKKGAPLHSTSQLIASLTASCFRQKVVSRLTLSYELLLMLGMLTRLRGLNCVQSEELSLLVSKFLPASLSLVKTYLSLYWISLQRPIASVHSIFDIASRVSSQSKATLEGLDMPATPETFETTVVDAASQLSERLISLLAPISHANLYRFATYLESSSQDALLMDFISLQDEPSAMLLFVAGQFYLSSDQPSEAKDAFMKAGTGISGHSDLFLVEKVRALQREELADSSEALAESDSQLLVAYYIHCMRLFDRSNYPEYGLLFATTALGLVSDRLQSFASQQKKLQAVLWSNIFKFSLDLAQLNKSFYTKAYSAIIANADDQSRKDCLLRFVVVLSERSEIDLLCRTPYTGLEADVEAALLFKAKCMNVLTATPNYYEILYTFHVFRNNYRSAALAMYELSSRLGQESFSYKDALIVSERQSECYIAAMNALRLVRPEHAWLELPYAYPTSTFELETIQKRILTSTRKRALPSDEDEDKVDAESPAVLVTLDQISKDYLLVRARNELLRHDPSLANALVSVNVSAASVFNLLNQSGHYDLAIAVAQKFNLDLTLVFESLAERCFKLASLHAHGSLGKASDWLQFNTLSLNSRNSLDSAWKLLQSYLDGFDGPDTNFSHHKSVASRFLAMDRRVKLPQWFVNSYKYKHPVELAQLYYRFNLLEDAVGVMVFYLDTMRNYLTALFPAASGSTGDKSNYGALMSAENRATLRAVPFAVALRSSAAEISALLKKGRPDAGNENDAHFASFATWLPVNLLDLLLRSLDKASAHRKTLETSWAGYFEVVKGVNAQATRKSEA